jgi:hypothetical protein
MNLNENRFFEDRLAARDIPFGMRLSVSEANLLRQMAQEAGASMSAVVRGLLRQGLVFRQLGGSTYGQRG